MPTNVTFDSLQSDLANYLERGGSALTDPVVFNQIPRLINAAERKLMQMLKLQGEIEVLVDAPAGLQAGNPVVTKPDRWRQTISINYGSGASFNSRTPLYSRSYEYCRAYWPDSTQTDPAQPPQFYADYDYTHWLIVPTPDQNYPAEFMVYAQPPLLDEANQTNFFTNYTPNALTYGSLVEASAFLKDDPRVQLWQQLYQVELQSLDGQDLQKILGRSEQRRRP